MGTFPAFFTPPPESSDFSKEAWAPTDAALRANKNISTDDITAVYQKAAAAASAAAVAAVEAMKWPPTLGQAFCSGMSCADLALAGFAARPLYACTQESVEGQRGMKLRMKVAPCRGR